MSSVSRSTASARSRTASSSGRAMTFHLIDKIAVEDEGDGDAVVCVHGLGGSSNTWTPLMGVLARHRTIRIDMPGSARSHAVGGPLSIERLMEAVADGVRAAQRGARALPRAFDGHHRRPAPRGRPAEAGAQPGAVRAVDGADRRCAHEHPRSCRESARRRRGRHAGHRADADERRDLRRLAAAHAGRRGVRAREPDAAGRRRLRAQLRGARRRAGDDGRAHRSADLARHRRRRHRSRRRKRCARWPNGCRA